MDTNAEINCVMINDDSANERVFNVSHGGTENTEGLHRRKIGAKKLDTDNHRDIFLYGNRCVRDHRNRHNWILWDETTKIMKVTK
jgi:hypothetical protein